MNANHSKTNTKEFRIPEINLNKDFFLNSCTSVGQKSNACFSSNTADLLVENEHKIFSIPCITFKKDYFFLNSATGVGEKEMSILNLQLQQI